MGASETRILPRRLESRLWGFEDADAACGKCLSYHVSENPDDRYPVSEVYQIGCTRFNKHRYGRFFPKGIGSGLVMTTAVKSVHPPKAVDMTVTASPSLRFVKSKRQLRRCAVMAMAVPLAEIPLISSDFGHGGCPLAQTKASLLIVM